MPEEAGTPVIDVAAIQAEIGKLTTGDMAEQLTKFRVRQKTQQKKQQSKGGMKKYQAKQREKFKAMKERALATAGTEVDPTTGKPYVNLWEQINAKADLAADQALEVEATEPEEEGDTATA